MADRLPTSPEVATAYDRLRTDVDELKEAAVEHRVRLENGTKVFAQMQDRLPKPMSPLKLFTLSFAVFTTVSTGVWGLAHMLRDRPTIEQIKEIMNAHDSDGHKAVRHDVREIQVEQGAQRQLIKEVQNEQKTADGKLDELLDRTDRDKHKTRR